MWPTTSLTCSTGSLHGADFARDARTRKLFYSGSRVKAGPWGEAARGKDGERVKGQPVRANASAEQRHRGLLDKRDMEAQLADDAKAERDLLQSRRRELIEVSRVERAKRDAASDEARIHEEKARAARVRLSGAGRGQKRGGKNAPESEEEKLERLLAEIAEAQRRLEREVMPIAEEKTLVEATRRKRRDADKLKAAVAARAPAAGAGADDLPHDETQLKQIIEEELGQANKLRGEAQSAHEASQKFSLEIDALTKEADAKHAHVLDHRAKANEIHEKAMKMRELVVAERAKRHAEQDEARSAMKEQSERVKASLYDEAQIEKGTDDAVAALKARGKLSL